MRIDGGAAKTEQGVHHGSQGNGHDHESGLHSGLVISKYIRIQYTKLRRLFNVRVVTSSSATTMASVVERIRPSSSSASLGSTSSAGSLVSRRVAHSRSGL